MRLAPVESQKDGFMSEDAYKRSLSSALKGLGIKVDSNEHVAHIIAGEHGGPNHVDNYYFVQDYAFNSSIRHMYDEFNCFQAGLERTKKAVRKALEVSRDPDKHEHLRGFREGKFTKFEESRLYRRHAKDVKPDMPLNEKVSVIANSMVDWGKKIWSEGFIKFMHLTNMRYRESEEDEHKSNANLRPPWNVFNVPSDRVGSLMGLVNIDRKDGDRTEDAYSDFLIRSDGGWYRIPVNEVQALAQNKGERDPRKGEAERELNESHPVPRMTRGYEFFSEDFNFVESLLAVADIHYSLLIKVPREGWYRIPHLEVQELAKARGIWEPSVDQGGGESHSECTETNEETDARETVTTPSKEKSSSVPELNTPQRLSAPQAVSSTPLTLVESSRDDSVAQKVAVLGTGNGGVEQGATSRPKQDPVYHIFRLGKDKAYKLGLIRSPTENPKTNTEQNWKKIKDFLDCELDQDWLPDPDRGKGTIHTEWVALRLSNRRFEGPLQDTFQGENASTAVQTMKAEGYNGVFALAIKREYFSTSAFEMPG